MISQCLDEHEPNSRTLPSKKKKKRKKLKVENGTHDVNGSQAESGASSALLCNGSSNVLIPPSTPPRRSAGECSFTTHWTSLFMTFKNWTQLMQLPKVNGQ